MSRRGVKTDVASSVPVDDTPLPYDADDVQEALEKTLTASGSSRLPAQFGYNGTAGTNKYLELFQAVPSNTSPFVFAEAGTVKTFSVAVRTTTTVTFTVYINEVSIGTLSLASASTGSFTLSSTIVADDELSVQVTSGSCNDPIFIVTTQVSA